VALVLARRSASRRVTWVERPSARAALHPLGPGACATDDLTSEAIQWRGAMRVGWVCRTVEPSPDSAEISGSSHPRERLGDRRRESHRSPRPPEAVARGEDPLAYLRRHTRRASCRHATDNVGKRRYAKLTNACRAFSASSRSDYWQQLRPGVTRDGRGTTVPVHHGPMSRRALCAASSLTRS